MTARQEDELTMYYGFKEFADAQTATTSKIPFFQETYVPFLSCHESILLYREIQEGDKSGVTLDKAILRKQVEERTLYFSLKLQAVAGVRKNQALAKEATYTASDLTRATDTRIKDIAGLLHTLATRHLTDLAVYNITADTLADFKTLVLQYGISIGQPKLVKDQQVHATAQIERLFGEANEQIKLMDKLVAAVKGEHPEFEDGYARATKVASPGSRPLAFRANAKDAKGNPLSNVTFEIISQRPASANSRLADTEGASLDPMVVKKTTESGNLQVKNLPDGTYTALVKKLGYQDQEVTFHVVAGEMVDLEVTLETA